MEKSESIKNITMALLNFQKLVGKIPKDSSNPFFKSKYAALPDILDKTNQPLIDSGLIVSQWPCGVNGLTTLVAHESGEYIMETYTMTPSKNDPQGIGSNITYQRRYAIGAVLNLNIDVDDDGNGASGLTGDQSGNTTAPPDQLPWLNETDKESWDKVVKALKGGKTMRDIRTKWAISKPNEAKLATQAGLAADINK